jgi:monoamine oxidase
MKTSENINELAKALAAAQGEMVNPLTDKPNPFFKSKYLTLAGLIDAIRGPLSKHGLAYVQTTELGDQFLFVRTTLMHTSGQWIESEYPIIIDVAKPQTMGSAMTYAKRYSLGALLGIAAEEDDDANTLHPEKNPNGNGSKPVATYPKARSREPFARLDQQINKFTSLDELHEWRGMTKAERQKLDADFQTDLDFNYIIQGIGIADSEAALHAFWKDAYKNIMPGMPMDKQDALTGKKDEAKLRFIPLPTLAAG